MEQAKEPKRNDSLSQVKVGDTVPAPEMGWRQGGRKNTRRPRGFDDVRKEKKQKKEVQQGALPMAVQADPEPV